MFYSKIKSTNLSYAVDVGCFGIKNYDKAIIFFTECIESDAQVMDAYFNRATSYKKFGKINEACEAGRKGENLQDRDVKCLLVKYFK